MSAESTLAELRDATAAELAPMFEQMEWAEDEISAARHRHPRAADTLHHSFALLRPTSDRMSTEFVYRGHCRELLDRVACREDTRPGTAAETVLAMCEVATATPLSSSGAGLLFRMWEQAFPGQARIDHHLEHRETLHGERIDDAEAETRAKLAVPDRVLGPIECTGWHHGAQVTCAYAPPPTLPFEPRTALMVSGR
ncbi:hypothetical protein AB8O55_24680 [Saccharopolyspora cebuensis]|uniref:DUF222 domain-containing protein n=1 Tax=Saccharopolyspora cebuensis TaxID=418759 RepID=A0ABV4CPF4_9PSEU